MRMLLAAAVLTVAAPAIAQTGAAPAPAPAPTAPARYTLETPLDVLVADPKAKAVLDADLPGLTTHSMFEHFKAMTLTQVAPMSGGRMTPEALAKVSADLAAIR